MGKRRVKKKIDKQTAASSPVPNVDAAYDPQVVDGEGPIIDQEVERQCAAIRAVRDVEIEHLRTRIRLLRSYFSEEHLQTPALQFFKENLPNVSVVKVDDSGLFELQWNDKDHSLSMNNVADGTDLHASLYRRLSMAFPGYSAMPPSFGGYCNGQSGLFEADNLPIRDSVLEGLSDAQMLGMPECLQTPGVSSQRLSIGMTPKTLRLPKPGEMLLSVHGSPLGVYKEDNMEAIRESEEG